MDYASNTHKSKENDIPEKTVEAVVETPPRIKKKTMLEEVADLFLPEDRPSIKDYILKDVIVPTIKRGIVSVVEMFFYGSTSTPVTARTTVAPTSRISYNSISSKQTKASTLTTTRTYDYGTLIFATRAEAQAVLDQMQEIIDVYNIASVNDLFDSAGLTGDATSTKWGWTSIEGAEVRVTDGGYSIHMPKARPIN